MLDFSIRDGIYYYFKEKKASGLRRVTRRAAFSENEEKRYMSGMLSI
jgi:hypothetical protein